jgi:hypothetical protein
MSNVQAQIKATYKGDGLTPQTAFRPAICDDYAMTWQDQTGVPVNQIQSGTTQLTIVATLDQATLNAILADPRYGPGVILSQRSL